VYVLRYGEEEELTDAKTCKERMRTQRNEGRSWMWGRGVAVGDATTVEEGAAADQEGGAAADVEEGGATAIVEGELACMDEELAAEAGSFGQMERARTDEELLEELELFEEEANTNH